MQSLRARLLVNEANDTENWLSFPPIVQRFMIETQQFFAPAKGINYTRDWFLIIPVSIE